MSRTLFLALLVAASSAFAQTEHLLMQNAPGVQAAATGSASMLIVFTKLATAPPCVCGEIDALRVDFDGNPVGTPFRVASSINLQTLPAVTFDGHNFLVVWSELATPPLFGETPSRVLGALVPENGEPLPPFVIANASVIAPVVVWDGTRYFVFYSDLQMHASGVTVSVQQVIGTPFRIGNADKVTGAAASPSEVVVLSLRGDKLELTTIDSALQVSGSVILGSGTGEGRVAWNGRTFLAVWDDEAGIEGRSLDNIYELHPIAADSYATALQLVASGPLFLAAWDDGAVATAWIGVDHFSTVPSIDTFPHFAIAPRYPILTSVPGKGIAMFYVRFFRANQFFTAVNAYVTFVTPPRQRVARR